MSNFVKIILLMVVGGILLASIIMAIVLTLEKLNLLNK